MKIKELSVMAAGAALIVAAGSACARSDSKTGSHAKASEAAIVTNDNGSVSRSYTECTISTNGNMVTEHRRETRTTLDTEGNMLETSTSEYAQSYPVGDEVRSITDKTSKPSNSSSEANEKIDNSSFLGLKFGSEFKANTNFVVDAEEPTLLRTSFKPIKSLAGFDDYYVYVTPTSHKVVKVFACAKNAVEPGSRWRRHCLIEALEKRYHTWARLCSYCRPRYAFDLGDNRYVTACLAGSSQDYETVLAAWDESLVGEAAAETEAIREAARKAASKQRESRVYDIIEAL